MSDRLVLAGWLSLLGVWTAGHTIGGAAGCAEDTTVMPTPDPRGAASSGSSAASTGGPARCPDPPDFACCLGDIEAEPSCVDGALTCKDGWSTAEVGDCSKARPAAVAAAAGPSSAASSSSSGAGGTDADAGCPTPCGGGCCAAGEICCADLVCAPLCL